MTILELVTHLRKNILHDIGGQGVDWTAYSDDTFDSIQLRWQNEELVANINEAITQVYRRTNPIKDVYELEVCADQSEYTLPDYIQNVISVRNAKGHSLKEKEIIEYFWDEDLDTNTGDLEVFIPDLKNRIIKLAPVPKVDETIKLLVYRYPKVQLTWEDLDGEPELLSQYQIPMLWYAAFLSYNKDEANVNDLKRASTFMSYFDREFPFTSVYSNIRKSRTTNRPIKYGGI